MNQSSNYLKSLFAAAALLATASSIFAKDILFVGNSFTHIPRGFTVSSGDTSSAPTLTGIPAIVHTMAQNSGKQFNIQMETAGGQTLEWHSQTNMDRLLQGWDVVILQEYSTRLLHTSCKAPGANISAYRAAVDEISKVLRAQNPEVKIILYQTWARPDLVESGLFTDIESMQKELIMTSRNAAKDFKCELAPVGEAFMSAVKLGYADDPSTIKQEGAYSLWGGDHYHQGRHGAYLSAAIFYAMLFDKDPRNLAGELNSAATQLRIDPEAAKNLQQLAYDFTVNKPDF